jgi:hypothetical protein
LELSAFDTAYSTPVRDITDVINMRASGQLYRIAGDHDALLAQFNKALLHHVGDELAGALIGEHLLLGLSKLGLELLNALELLFQCGLLEELLFLAIIDFCFRATTLAADLHQKTSSAPRLYIM